MHCSYESYGNGLQGVKPCNDTPSPPLPPPVIATVAAQQVAHRYVKQRRNFGRHPHFTDQGAEVRCGWCFAQAWWLLHVLTTHGRHMLQLLLDLRPNEEHAKEWVVKPQTTVAVQAAPDMSEHEVCHLT
jgi:hypothetical protein